MRLYLSTLIVSLVFIATHASAATVTTFSGSSAGEGLDLQGTFAHAIDIGGK